MMDLIIISLVNLLLRQIFTEFSDCGGSVLIGASHFVDDLSVTATTAALSVEHSGPR